MNLTLLYRELAAGTRTGALDADVQRRILEHAQRNDARELVPLLLARGDLDRELDREIGTSTELDVLIPWMLRTGRDPEELAERLNRETRVKVLSTLAATAGLPETVYETLAGHRSERVLWALAANHDAPLPAVKTAVRGIVTGSPRSNNRYDVAAQLTSLVTGSRYTHTLWDEVAMHAMVLPYVLAALEHGRPTPEHIERWITDLTDLHHYDGGRWRENTGRLAAALTGHGMTRSQHRRLLSAVWSLIENAPHKRVTWYQELTSANNALRAYDIRLEERIQELGAETDPLYGSQALEDLHRVCVGAQRRRLFATAIANPAIPLGDLYALRASLHVNEIGNLVQRLREAGRRDLLISWLDEHRDREHFPILLSFVPDHNELIAEYLEQLSGEGRLWPAWALHTVYVRKDPELALAHLPWAVLCGNTNTVDGLADLVGRRLAHSLQGDDVWEAFESIGSSFDGSFDDLVTVVTALSE